MSYLVDTNIVSELRKGPRANAGVVNWFAVVEYGAMYLSDLTIDQLMRGV